jgi:hypothetical protein
MVQLFLILGGWSSFGYELMELVASLLLCANLWRSLFEGAWCIFNKLRLLRVFPDC